MNPTFYRITVCQIITLFGNAALRFALPLYLLRRIDSAALYGSVTALALVPMLLGTLAGPCPHRADRPLYEPYHGLCLPDPAGRAGGARAFVWPLCRFAQCRAFCGGCSIAYFQKSRFFFKIMNAFLPIY